MTAAVNGNGQISIRQTHTHTRTDTQTDIYNHRIALHQWPVFHVVIVMSMPMCVGAMSVCTVHKEEGDESDLGLDDDDATYLFDYFLLYSG